MTLLGVWGQRTDILACGRLDIVRPTRLYSSVPKPETGTPKLFWRGTERVKITRESNSNTRPTECPTRPRRMIDASRVYTFI